MPKGLSKVPELISDAVLILAVDVFIVFSLGGEQRVHGLRNPSGKDGRWSGLGRTPNAR
jgi:hypothetical protein